ncbi:alpha/beta hydrolase [Vibrio astriarenae]
MYNFKAYLVVFVFFSNPVFSVEREDTVCGWFKERLLFQLWSSAAPEPDESRVFGNVLIQEVKFTTSDDKILQGYKYLSHDENGKQTKPKGYVLMALGNAMVADQIISYLKPISQRGYDSYIFDYRGYGKSQGKRRINAFIEDYKELVAHFNAQYEKHLLYGISLGGAVIANVIGSGVPYDRVVIDSSPSRFSPYGCPKRIDPSENIPDDSTNMLVITGAADPVLGPEMTSEFRELAKQKGATVFNGADYSHPFMDKRVDIHRARLNKVANFLDDKGAN